MNVEREHQHHTHQAARRRGHVVPFLPATSHSHWWGSTAPINMMIDQHDNTFNDDDDWLLIYTPHYLIQMTRERPTMITHAYLLIIEKWTFVENSWTKKTVRTLTIRLKITMTITNYSSDWWTAVTVRITHHQHSSGSLIIFIIRLMDRTIDAHSSTTNLMTIIWASSGLGLMDDWLSYTSTHLGLIRPWTMDERTMDGSSFLINDDDRGSRRRRTHLMTQARRSGHRTIDEIRLFGIEAHPANPIRSDPSTTHATTTMDDYLMIIYWWAHTFTDNHYRWLIQMTMTMTHDSFIWCISRHLLIIMLILHDIEDDDDDDDTTSLHGRTSRYDDYFITINTMTHL